MKTSLGILSLFRIFLRKSFRRLLLRSAALGALIVITAVLSGCATKFGFNEAVSTIKLTVTTSTDHLTVSVDGIKVLASTVDTKEPAELYTSIEGDSVLHVTPGIESANAGHKVTVVWILTVEAADKDGKIEIKEDKGHIGALQIAVEGPDKDGKTVQNLVQIGEGGSGAFRTITIPYSFIQAGTEAGFNAETEPDTSDSTDATETAVSDKIDPAILGTWGNPKVVAYTTITFNADGTAKVYNFPAADGTTLISGDFQFQTTPDHNGVFLSWNAKKELTEYPFYYKIDNNELQIGIENGRGFSFLPKVK